MFAGSGGELQDNGVLYFSGSTLYSHTQVASNTITAGEFIGPGTIPVGGIIMWSGNTVPTGWSLCNGSNGTPDLRNRFIVGSGDSYNTGATGGDDSYSLTLGQLPEHFHSQPTHTHPAGTLNVNGDTGNQSANHSHNASLSVTINNNTTGIEIRGGGSNDDGGEEVPGGNHSDGSRVSNAVVDPGHGHTGSASGTTDANNANHTHNVDLSVSGSTGDGGNQNTGTLGNGDAIDNRPQYYALAYIMRTT